MAPARHSVEGVLMTLSLDPIPAGTSSGGDPRVYIELLREMPISTYDPAWIEPPAGNWPKLPEDQATPGRELDRPVRGGGPR